MHGLEVVSKDPAEIEIDIESYAAALSRKLAVNGLSILRYGQRLAARAEDVADRVAQHGVRAPVAPDLPELHGWLKQATTLRGIHETQGLEGPVASDRDIVAILAHFEPLFEEADWFYNG